METIPTSSEHIPPDTGLVQSINCKGIAKVQGIANPIEPLEEVVTAQISTFANGIRKVSCLYALESPAAEGAVYCSASANGTPSKCIYSWGNPKN
jgi:hypothetical protein